MTPLILAAGKIASTMSTTAKLWWGLKEGATVAVEAAQTFNEAKEVVGVGAEIYHRLMDKKEDEAEVNANAINNDGKEIEADEGQPFYSNPNPALKAALKKFKEGAPLDHMDAYRKQNFYANSNPNRLLERETPTLKRTNSSPSFR